MLTLLKISNIALIDELTVEFDQGLNLLTGETGSGKSIIVDALGVLIGARFTADLLKTGSERGSIEGLFSVSANVDFEKLLADAGIEFDAQDGAELIIRRELAANGRNKIFINHQLATQSLLRELRPFLVDIHGQGDQQTLFDTATHIQLLDTYADVAALKREVLVGFKRWASLRQEIDDSRKEEAERFQMIDTLRFQIDELERAQLAIGEDEQLEEEKRRLNNVEKLTTLGSESFNLIYDDSDSAITRIRQTARRIDELSNYESSFREYVDGIETARALLEELAFSLRDFTEKLEFSPARLEKIENRLAELSRLKRKYGGSVETALEHLARSQDRLHQIERSDEREEELKRELATARAAYLERAQKLHRQRVRSAKNFERAVENDLAGVAMERTIFQIKISLPEAAELESDEAGESFAANGIDRVEFYFSANVGEEIRPLAKVASGGEASRLMLVLKTVAGATEFPRTIVFDEIDSGIGGRVSEAVGLKLKKLANSNQVFCVTHQPQIARLADAHLLVRKEVVAGRAQISVDRLDRPGRIEEIARMLTGAEITETARRHAREMLKA